MCGVLWGYFWGTWLHDFIRRNGTNTHIVKCCVYMALVFLCLAPISQRSEFSGRGTFWRKISGTLENRCIKEQGTKITFGLSAQNYVRIHHLILSVCVKNVFCGLVLSQLSNLQSPLRMEFVKDMGKQSLTHLISRSRPATYQKINWFYRDHFSHEERPMPWLILSV